MNNNAYTDETQRLYDRVAEPEAEWQRSDPDQKERNRLLFLAMALCVLLIVWYSLHPGQSINSRGTPLEGEPAPRIVIIDNSSHVRAFCWCSDSDGGKP